MKEPKDLFGLIEEDLTEDKKQEKPLIPPSPIITQQELEESRVERSFETVAQPKKKKKHFRYKDGKVQYMSAFSEQLRDVLRGDVRKSDRSLLLRNMATIVVVFCVAFFFLVIKDGVWFISSQGESPPSSTDIVQKDEPGENSAMTLEEIQESLRMTNAKEIEKVEKYLDIKSNRVSTIAEINNAKREKENLYLFFLDSEKTMTKTDFAVMEELIIRSVSMSKELLVAFENGQGNEEIRTILNQYTKGGN